MSKTGVIITFIVAIVYLGLGLAIGYSVTTEHWREAAIERGAAEYHPETGEWQWIDEVVEEEDE